MPIHVPPLAISRILKEVTAGGASIGIQVCDTLLSLILHRETAAHSKSGRTQRFSAQVTLPFTSNCSSGNWHALIKRACACFEQLQLQQVRCRAA
jgi:hypothetical protein